MHRRENQKQFMVVWSHMYRQFVRKTLVTLSGNARVVDYEPIR